MTKYIFTISNDAVLLVVGGTKISVARGEPHFQYLREALISEKWDAVEDHLTARSSLEKWAGGRFKVGEGDDVLFDGQPVEPSLIKRARRMVGAGEDPSRLFKFWELLQQNPSSRSVAQLWNFLDREGIPLDEEGYILAYKAVRSDFKDIYTGTLLNTVGAKIDVPRNRVSDDPDVGCHFGLHVGSKEYAEAYAGSHGSAVMVICRASPADVVCVPRDCSFQKVRLCKYEVVGLHVGGLMSSTSLDLSETGYQYVDQVTGMTTLSAQSSTAADVDDDDDEEDNWVDDDDWGDDEDVDDDVEEAPPSGGVVVTPVPIVPDALPKDAEDNATFLEIDKLSGIQLYGRELWELRRYASRHLKMVGASKLLGGKIALVDRIVATREILAKAGK